MTTTEDELISLINSTFKSSTGSNEPIAKAVHEAYLKNNISFCLESKHGSIIEIGKQPNRKDSSHSKEKALPVIVPENNENRRFIFSIAPHMWEVLTCFMVNDSVFFTTIVLYEPESSQACLRAGIMKLLGHLSGHCHKILSDFTKDLLPITDVKNNANPHHKEKSVLDKTTSFSHNVNCIVLIDNDGFILYARGNAEGVEKTASNMALFHQRSVRELDRMGTAHITSETISCKNNTVLVGQIGTSKLALAISVKGLYSRPLTTFLYESAHWALKSIAQNDKILWGVEIDQSHKATRMRYSWFKPAQLVPLKKFVSKHGGKSFHLPVCRNLLKTEDSHLEWFDKRAEAIRAGYTPCRACNP